jgi:hypothetical protein
LAFMKNNLVHLKVDCMYMTPHIDHYMEPHKYNESLFILCNQELQVEFQLDIMVHFFSYWKSTCFWWLKEINIANDSLF